jgi:hypothetical protein
MSSKKLHLSNKVKILATSMAVIVSTASVIPSFAADSSNSSSGTDETLVPMTSQTATANASTGEVAQDIAAAQSECADVSNPNGLAAAAAAAYQDRNTIASASPNVDKLFNIAEEGGCFSALKDFPNLSVAIPSLSSIADALQNTLIKYATRKVCKAVNEVLSEAIDPINDAIGEIAKNGEIDLTGAINTGMINKAYEIDPDLGRVTDTIDGNEYTLSGMLTNNYSTITDSGDSTGNNGSSTTTQSSPSGDATTTAQTKSSSKNILDLIF